jgi:hypothetical protein
MQGRLCARLPFRHYFAVSLRRKLDISQSFALGRVVGQNPGENK